MIATISYKKNTTTHSCCTIIGCVQKNRLNKLVLVTDIIQSRIHKLDVLGIKNTGNVFSNKEHWFGFCNEAKEMNK